MMGKITILLWMVFLLFGQYSLASDDVKYYSDFQLQHKLSEKIAFFIQPTMRFKDDMGRFYYYHFRNGLTLHMYKNLDLGAAYRFVRHKSSSGKWSNEHRYELNIAPKINYSEFKIKHRSRFEYRDLETTKNRWRYRCLFQVAHPTEMNGFKFTPFVSEEFFYDFEIEKINLNWITIGVTRKLSDSFTVGLYYRPESVRLGNKSEWNTNHVLGTKVVISF